MLEMRLLLVIRLVMDSGNGGESVENNYLGNDYVRLENADQLVLQFADIMISDDIIMRLINYDDDDALSPQIPEVSRDKRYELIDQRREDKRIFFTLYSDDVEDDVQTQLRMEIVDAPSEDNVTSRLMIAVEVLAHNSIQTIDNSTKNRTWRISSRFVDLLNGNTNVKSASPPLYNRGRGIKKRLYNKHFSGHFFYMYVLWKGDSDECR